MADIWLLDWLVHDGTSETTLRYSTTPGFDPADDTIDSYEPRIIDPGFYEQYLFGNGTTIGASSSGAGRIVLNNRDGALDAIRSYGFGRQAVLRKGARSLSNPSEFTTILTVTVVNVEFSDEALELVLENRLSEFQSKPIVEQRFSGDDSDATYGAGKHVNGTEDTLKDKTYPLWLGNGGGENAEPVLVNDSTQTFCLSIDPLDSITTVEMRGTGITPGSAHSTLNSLQNATPTGGTFDYYLGDRTKARTDVERAAYIRIGSALDGKVTFNGVEGWKNLFTYTEAFDNAAWTKNNTTVSADSVTSPNGNTDADTLVEDGTTNAHSITQAQTVTANKDYTFSVFAKAKDRTQLRLDFPDGQFGANTYADFDLDAATATAAASASASIVALSDGWYRCVVTAEATSGASATFTINMLDDTGTVSYAGDATSGIYLFGAQVEQVDAAGPYVKNEGSTNFNNSAAQLTYRIMQEKGATLDVETQVVFDENISAAMGHYVPDETETGQVIDEIMEGVNGWWIDQNDGSYAVGLLPTDPSSETSVATIEEWMLAGSEKVRRVNSDDPGEGVPASEIVFNYDKNHTTMNEGELAGIVGSNDERVQRLKKEWKSTRQAAAASLTTKHPRAVPFTVNGLVTTLSEANTLATRQKTIRATTERFQDEFTVAEQFARSVNIGDIVTLNYDRYSTTGTEKYVIIGKNAEFETDEITLRGWK